MSHRWLVLLFALPVLAGDKPKTGGPFTVDIDKPKAKYSLYVPETYAADHSWPLLVTLHAGGTTAEANLKLYYDQAKKHGYIVASPKARGDNWEDTDGDIILAVLDDVKKKYNVDPDRVCLGGSATGAMVVTRWGLKHHEPWRCLFAHGAAVVSGDVKAAASHVYVYLSWGDKDTNKAFIRKVYDQLAKDGFKAEWFEFRGMDHFEVKPEIWEEAFKHIEGVFNKPEEVLARGKHAEKDKRWRDAVLALKSIADPKGNDTAKAADKELAALDKQASDLIAEAVKKGEKDKPGAKADLEAIAAQFDGLDSAKKAKDKAEEMGKGK